MDARRAGQSFVNALYTKDKMTPYSLATPCTLLLVLIGCSDSSEMPALDAASPDGAVLDAALPDVGADATESDVGRFDAPPDAGRVDAGPTDDSGTDSRVYDGGPATPCTEGVVFYDSFESADMDSTNVDGFSWGSLNRTSLVSTDGEGPLVVFNGNAVSVRPSGSRDWGAFDGDISLRFRYVAGQEMTEQRFRLGAFYEEVWITYWIRVPTNFTHGSANNKFLSLWPETYDTPGTVTWQTRNDGSGGAVLRYQDGGVTSGEVGTTPFITVPADRGRWMHVVFHVQSATARGADDGVIQMFRRWDGDADYETLHEKADASTWENGAGDQGISQGYIMGWANDPYDENTEWLVDEFQVSESDCRD